MEGILRYVDHTDVLYADSQPAAIVVVSAFCPEITAVKTYIYPFDMTITFRHREGDGEALSGIV